MKPAAQATPNGSPGGPSSLITSMWDDPPASAAQPAATQTDGVQPPAEPTVTPAPELAAEPGSGGEFIPEPSAIPSGLITPAEKPAPNSTPAEPIDHDPDPDEVVKSGPKAMNAYQKIKLEKKAALQKAAELEQKYKDLEAKLNSSKPPEMQQLVDMQRQLAEYEDKIGQLDIVQSRAFKTRFDIPMDQQVRRGEQILIRQGVEPTRAKELMKTLTKAGSHEAAELIADQPMPVQGALFNIVTDINQIASDREEAIANWKQTRAAMNETEIRDQEIQLAQNIESDTAAAVQQALAEGNFMFNTNGNMPKEWNEAVNTRINALKGILRTAKPVELVKWVAEGLTARDTRLLLAKEHSRANALEAELKARQNLRPRLGGGNHSPVTAPSTGKPTSAIDLANSLF